MILTEDRWPCSTPVDRCREAETVRREWLATFVARKTAPKGAEALICEAVVTGHHSLSKAMDHRHPMLFTLLGIDVPTGYYGAGYEECHKIATRRAGLRPRP